MNSSQIILISIIAFLICGLLACEFLLKNKEKYSKVLSIVLKVSAITLFSFYIVRNTLSDQFIWVINGGTYNSIRFDNHDYLQSFLRWSFLVSVCIMPVAAFYKNRTLKRFAFYIGFVNVVLSLVFYNNYMNYFLKAFRDPTIARGIITKDWFRYFEFDMELAAMSIGVIMLGYLGKKDLLFHSLRDVLNFVCYLPTLFLVAIPVYVPQSLFGFTRLVMKLPSIQHFVWLAGTVALCFFIYMWFRNKDKELQKIVVCYICLFVFQHYNSIYLMDLVASRLPFQLCNVGSYFMLIAFIFHNKPKMQKFFDFIFIVNVFGTLVATIGFDLKEGMLSYWNIHYYLEHIWIFAIPYLMVAFGIYKVPDKHCYLHAWVGFTAYFVACLTCGLIFNGYFYDPASRFWNKVNYFYLFDDTVANVLVFLNKTYKYSIYINHKYVFNPIIPAFVYVIYSIGCVITFLINKKILSVAKDHTELHYKKLAFKKAAKEIE